jgi:hypothetical protein
MSRWAEKFAALSCDVDRSDTSRHIANAVPDMSRSVHSVRPASESRSAATWPDAGAEHGAIVAYNGGIPPVWVEGVAHLHPKHPPVDVPPNRWGTFINDVHRFLDSPFCAAAMALGWKAHDLFGCDRGRPFARIDQAGLLWLLNGDQVIALTADTAVIERKTGARQTWRRKATETTQVLVWELRSPCAARR